MSVRRIDSSAYLQSYGWTEGEALRKGGLRKPILVKHKWDKKGLGSLQRKDDGEAWWERLFDGQLKSLDVGTSDSDNSAGGIIFKQNKVVASGVSKQSSPLYQWFVKGESLKGTLSHSSEGSSIEKNVVATKLVKETDKVRKGSKKRVLDEEETTVTLDGNEKSERKKRKLDKSKRKHSSKDKDKNKHKDKANKREKSKERKSKKHSSSSKERKKERKEKKEKKHKSKS